MNDIKLGINKGEKILLAGPSGSGKTTIGNCINGLIPHSYPGEETGTLKVAALHPGRASLHELSKFVGTVLQDTDGQFVGLSVGEDVAFALENDAAPRDRMERAVREATGLVAMEEFLTRSPFALSGGQKQRVSLAGILVDDVDILLFDEPLANLDPATGKTAIELIDKLHKETGKTIIIIEHRLEDVLHRPVDRIVLINRGQIVADDSPDAVLASKTLRVHGIREPLYLEALRMAGCAIEADDRPSSLDTLKMENHQKALHTWFNTRPHRTKANPSPDVLSVSNVHYSYDGEIPVLQELDFHIAKGERVSLLGENGAGKSTLAKIIMGLIRPDQGQLHWEGENITQDNIAKRSRKVGFVMQNPNHMISQHLIRDEVALGPRLRGDSDETVQKRVEDALKICGLHPFRNWPISALSFGQRKRVTIASILVMDPQLLIMDEPTAGQDYKHYTDFMNFVMELNQKTGLSMLLVTHDLHLALEYTQRSLVLSKGRLIADDAVSKIFSDPRILNQAGLKATSLYELSHRTGIGPADEFIAHFIASEEKNRCE